MPYTEDKNMKRKIMNKKRKSISSTFRKSCLPLSYKSNLDNMKLLVSDKEFQDMVNEIRRHLEIPNDGFFKNDPGFREWYANFIKKSGEILDCQKFRRQEIRIRKKFKLGEINRSVANKQMNLLYEKTPLNFLWQRTEFIVHKFNLPIHYGEHIKEYILRGIISAPLRNYTHGPYPPHKKPSEERYIPIKIYTRLTKEEIKELKNYIDLASEGLLSYYRPLKNIDRDLKIEKWYENKERMDEVDKVVYRSSNAEIAENLLKNHKKGKSVYDIQRDLKKLREKRFKFREIPMS